MSEHDETRRMVSADYYRKQHEALMAALTRSGEPYVTVELSRNAKGETQHSVKVSAPAGHDLPALEDYANHVRLLAVKAYEATSMRFPTATGTVTNDAPPRGEK